MCIQCRIHQVNQTHCPGLQSTNGGQGINMIAVFFQALGLSFLKQIYLLSIEPKYHAHAFQEKKNNYQISQGLPQSQVILLVGGT